MGCDSGSSCLNAMAAGDGLRFVLFILKCDGGGGSLIGCSRRVRCVGKETCIVEVYRKIAGLLYLAGVLTMEKCRM